MAPFAFRALPVFSAKDATLDFEQLTFALNNGAIEVNTKGELALTTPLSKGVAELTFGAGAKNSGSVKVKHLLGRTPTVVLCTPTASPAFEQIPLINVVTIEATEFAANAEIVKAVVGETKIKFSWLAVA